jgi:adenosylmethionine-8-amino-7-oxononanoate aminotransferase
VTSRVEGGGNRETVWAMVEPRESNMKVNPDHSHVIHYNLKRDIPVVDRGEGIYLVDTDGKRYIDACSGPVAANIDPSGLRVSDAVLQ